MEINGQFLKHLTHQGNKYISLALVKQIYIEQDEVLMDVTLIPTGETPLVRMGWDYEGNGFGLYVLPEVEDEVLCIFPDGNLNNGICIKRLNNGIDKIPNEVSTNKILLRTKPGHNIQIIVPNGNVNVEVTGNLSANVSGNTDIVSGPTTINAPIITLAGGGPAVARQGDPVVVEGMVHGTMHVIEGHIVSGSSKVNSG